MAAHGCEPLLDPTEYEPPLAGPERPLANRYDFLEVRCGGPWISPFLQASYAIGPVIDFKASPFFTLSDSRCLEWVLWLLQERKLRSILVVPPVGSFSPCWQPPLRSWKKSLGTSGGDRVRMENAVLLASLAVLLVAARCRALAILLHPALSFARGLEGWRGLLDRGLSEVSFASCGPGCSSAAPRVALVAEPPASKIALCIAALPGPCDPSSAHGLGRLFSEHLASALPAASPPAGLESLAMNDLLLANSWITVSSWAWRDGAHINQLESRSFLHAVKRRALEGEQRFVHGVDSSATLGAFSKGRSSSRRLAPLVQKAGALQAAFGLYGAIPFCPTRLNISDAPTRLRPLPEPVPASLLRGLPVDSLYPVSCLAGLSRASSGWLRLAILLVQLRGGSRVSLIRSLSLKPRDCLPGKPPPPLEKDSFEHAALSFDQTLGYPGEGPLAGPRSKWDVARAAGRAGVVLGEGRPVLDRTTKNLRQLLQAFSMWLLEQGVSLETLLAQRPPDPGTVADLLTKYGRELFHCGRPYWHLSETINAVASARPELRRGLQGAWDLAFSWMAKEPSTCTTLRCHRWSSWPSLRSASAGAGFVKEAFSLCAGELSYA